MKLWKYQKKDYKLIKKELKVSDHILFSAATGYGKSAIIYKAVDDCIKRGERVLVIAPRRKLVKQLDVTLADFLGSVIMGSDTSYVEDDELYIASTATLHNRLKKHGKKYVGKIGLVLIDEVHINFGTASMQEVIDLYWDSAKWIGLSATPIDDRGYRLEGWDKTVGDNQSGDLIKKGKLTPVRVMVEDKPKGLDDLKMTGGDYNEGDLADFMMDGSRVSNIFSVYDEHARGRKTMIFAVTINHCDIILKDFLDNGVRAAAVHSDMDEDDEDISLTQFTNGDVDVIISVGKLTTGFDETSVDCLIMARPTKSLRLYLQMIGRGLRLHPGKTECLILDVAGTIEQHGYPTMRRDFNMKRPPARKAAAAEFQELECMECGYKTQFRNCSKSIDESKEFTHTKWHCPMCDEVIKELLVDNKEVQRMKEIQDYSDISKVTNKDVSKMVQDIAKKNGYKPGWVGFIARDYKKHPEIKDGMKLIYKKVSLEMCTLDTALKNINKLRGTYAA